MNAVQKTSARPSREIPPRNRPHIPRRPRDRCTLRLRVSIRYRKNDTPAVIIDGAMYVPLRFMCRTFNLDCTWGSGFSQVVIFDSFSNQRVTWGRDDGWAARPHAWQHPVTYRASPMSQSPPRQFFQGKNSQPASPAAIIGGHAVQGRPSQAMKPGGNKPPSIVHGQQQPANRAPTPVRVQLPSVVHGQKATGQLRAHPRPRAAAVSIPDGACSKRE